MTRFRRWSPALGCPGPGLARGSGSHTQLAGQPPAAVPPPMARDAGSFSPVVKRVLPAVVSIEVKARTGAKPDAPGVDDPGFGSGVLIDPSGVVLTNYHVVQDAAE